MKADLTLQERQRLEAENQQEIRAALVRRNADVLDEHYAIEGVQTFVDINSPAYRAMAASLRR